MTTFVVIFITHQTKGDKKMSNKEKAKPTSVRINPELKAKIATKAKEEGRSFNNMVSRILELSLAQ